MTNKILKYKTKIYNFFYKLLWNITIKFNIKFNKNKNNLNLILNENFENTDDIWDRWSSHEHWGNIRGITIYKKEQIKFENNQCIIINDINDNIQEIQQNILYKSCMLCSNFYRRYGYFEIKCKVPSGGYQIHPSFWTYGEIWPPEIDGFEFKDKEINKTNIITLTLHWKENEKHNSYSQKLQYNSFNDNFHIYGFEWTPEKIKWYINNIPVGVIFHHIPNNEHQIIINCEIHKEFLPQKLPKLLIIDWIKIYQFKKYNI